MEALKGRHLSAQGIAPCILGTTIFHPRRHGEQSTNSISDGIEQTLKNAVSFAVSLPAAGGALANGFENNNYEHKLK
jgi:hypothetical protein